MLLTVYLHPFASYCQKALIAFYENDVAFTPKLVESEADGAELRRIWPIAKFPVLVDGERVVPEATIIIEYVAKTLIPADPDLARETRLADRFYDNYVMDPMQRIVADRLRARDAKDPTGVGAARAALGTAYDMIEKDMARKTWAVGDAFTLADCAAAPALRYADMVEPFGARPHVRAYLERLKARPSFARVLAEAEPYAHLFPAA